ncbi:Signal transduction histidine kinase [Pseudobutyrivibrio sp. YE44]|uniref:response regulator n=1 Tax=Pseudobutyrivibrio sp. YE44 TaxID=1520802 RepID=UPI0008861560|nr:response regulator [Pseudobutyrivibrio sp. YE44]SDB05465.1 Signal transduction histidine kinase [Pseudobutyrivibrio sp. YE44]
MATGNQVYTVKVFTSGSKLNKLVGSIVLLVLGLGFCYISSSHGGDYFTNSGTEVVAGFYLLPTLLLAGLYGYLVSFFIFLVGFIITLCVNMNNAYSMVIYMAAILCFSLCSQDLYFKKLWKTIVTCTITFIFITFNNFLCFSAVANMNYKLHNYFSTNFYTYKEIIAIYGTGLLLYLFFNYAPDKWKYCFPLGVVYLKDNPGVNDIWRKLRKTRVSVKITATIILVEIVLGIGVAVFMMVLFPDIKKVFTTRQRDLNNSESVQTEQMVTDLENMDFRIDNAMISFDVKMIMLMLCAGVPLAGFANFYTKSFIAGPLGEMSDFMASYATASDDDKIIYGHNIDDIVVNSHDEIRVMYEAVHETVYEMEAFIQRQEERQQIESDLEVARRASEAKSSFLSNMSHEIRTPINAVLGMDEMILRESKDEEILGYASDIKRAGTNLLRIVNDILDFSKIEAGKMEIIPVEYELSSVLNDLVNMIKNRAEEKGLKIIVNVDPTIPHLLFGDEIRLKQIITNILTNAVKYTENGGIVLGIKWKACSIEEIQALDENIIEQLDKNCRAKGNITLEVSVEDTGIGIKPEDMDKLFNSFERADEKRNRTIEGTGLGMSITTNLLSLMGSKLEVQSDYGVGSKFSFDIVQRIVDEKPIGEFSQNLIKSEVIASNYRESFIAPDASLLVVDDTEINLTVFKNLLKQTQVNIYTANSGFECLEMIKERKYDIIFLDHRMPEMDGIECLQLIKADKDGINNSTPVIALTANAVSGAREMYLDAGFDNYLTKPISADLLEEMIVELLPEDLVQKRDESLEEISEEELPDWMEKLPFIEPELGVVNCGGNESYLYALHAYMDALEDVQNDIKSALEEDRIKDYTTKVHALKSSSKIIGAMEIGSLAEELEKAGNDNNLDAINSYTDQLLSYHKALGVALKRYMKSEDSAEDKPEITRDKLKEAYDALKEIGMLFDYDSAQSIIEVLEDYRMPEDEAEKYEAIKKALNNADWEELNKLMSE